ncbi:FtsQ-type POTRA domain-containing protein [bacterium]|nr:FtsQ-type POTRA domain-containing protein [bacterium]
MIIFSGIFYFFVLSSFFQIEKIKIIGNQKVSEKKIEVIVCQNVSHKILFFLTKSIFLVNSDKIKKELTEIFPQIQKVKLERDFPKTLIVRVKEREPIGVWCGSPQSCFFIDEEGVIFEKVQIYSGLRIETSQKFFKVTLGKKVIKKEDLEKILKIWKKLKKELKIEIEKIVIVSSIYLKVKTLEGWWIYFDPSKDIDWQITELGLILEKKISPQKRGKLEYINLRFDKIYVFPEEVLE